MDPGFVRFRGLSLGWYVAGLATATGLQTPGVTCPTATDLYDKRLIEPDHAGM